MQKKLAIVVLAAGKSTRMKSEVPKACHLLCRRPMLSYVLDLARSLRPERTIVVTGYKRQEVEALIPRGIKTVQQDKLLGTADAVRRALPQLVRFNGTVLILYADIPLLKKETLQKLIKHHSQNNLSATVLSAIMKRPTGYGRIVRDEYESVSGIIEDKDANDLQKAIKEINTGIICFDSRKLSYALARIKPNNRQKEFYLTDAIGILYKNGGSIDSVRAENADEVLGVNSCVELAQANAVMQARINEEFMKKGVNIVSPKDTFISFGTKIGQDTTIYPFTVIEKDVKIGKYCSIGPFAHLRDGAVVGNGVCVGNFIEIVRSKIGEKTFLKHFSYIGDTRIGKSVNIGAGTVVANFDGKDKHTTTIKDNAFIGSDSVLISPVKIGRSAKTGAGSVVLKDTSVPDYGVVVGVPAKLKGVKNG